MTVQKGALLKNVTFDLHGKQNRIVIGEQAILRDCRIYISGSHNTVCIGKHVKNVAGEIWIEDDHNTVAIGDNSSLCGKSHLACTEGKSILIGENCLFSSDITFRTGDSHSILDKDGNRINQAKDIRIGNHVWLGNRVIILKGTAIADNSIVGTGAVVTRAFTEEHTILAGVPAKVVKNEINWKTERV